MEAKEKKGGSEIIFMHNHCDATAIILLMLK